MWCVWESASCCLSLDLRQQASWSHKLQTTQWSWMCWFWFLEASPSRHEFVSTHISATLITFSAALPDFPTTVQVHRAIRRNRHPIIQHAHFHSTDCVGTFALIVNIPISVSSTLPTARLSVADSCISTSVAADDELANSSSCLRSVSHHHCNRRSVRR